MGIGSILKTGLKYIKTVPRYAFGGGNEVISAARKSKYASGAKFETIFKNPLEKAKAGISALHKDVLATAAKPSFFSKLKSLWKSGVNTATSAGAKLGIMGTIKAGLKGIGSAAVKAVKGAYQAGGIKGILKPLKKMPLLGTLLTIGWEIPDIVKAFKDKDSGFTEGCKQILKSGAKIVTGTIFSAVGAALGGPVGGALGYLAGEQLASFIVGGSYSETHPEEATEKQSQAQSQSTEGSQSSEQSQTSQEASQETSSSSSSSGSSSDATGSATSSTPSYPTSTGMTNPFGLGLNVPNPAMIGLNNPFGFGIGSGMYNPVFPMMNQILQPGENIFEKYPLGFRFQYMGN